MPKYIDAEKLNKMGQFWIDGCILVTAVKDLDEMSSADVQEVKHGKWIKKANEIFTDHYIVVCSVCGKEAFYDEVHGYYDGENYCHHCGAKMDGDEK